MSVHIPLPRPALVWTTDETNLQVQLVVSVLDNQTVAPSLTSLNAHVIVDSGKVNTWCQQAALPSAFMGNVLDKVDLIVGIAGDLNSYNHLQRIQFASNPSPLTGSGSAQIASRSIESGLLTFVITGRDDYFGGMPNTFNVQIQDLITVHVFGQDKWTAVSALPNVATVSTNVAGSLGVPRLVPNPAFASLCVDVTSGDMRLLQPLPASQCAYRYDVAKRAAVQTPPTVVEMTGPGTATNSEAFMKTVLGSSAAYSTTLADSFANLVQSDATYNLNSPGNPANHASYKRAFWINPALSWKMSDGTSYFGLSQHIMVIALVTMSQGDGIRRSKLLSTSSSAPSTNLNAQLSTPVTPATAFAIGLGVSETLASTWNIHYELSDLQVTLRQYRLVFFLNHAGPNHAAGDGS